MLSEESYINERLDHLGIVAGVYQEIGLATWLDAQDTSNRQQVSGGTATVTMVLNGLGFSNRQLYLFGTHLVFVVHTQSHQTVCRDCEPSTLILVLRLQPVHRLILNLLLLGQLYEKIYNSSS